MDRYLELVQQTADRLGLVFVLDEGAGNGWATPDLKWYVEKLSGWLVRFDETGAQSHPCTVCWAPVPGAKPEEAPVTVWFEGLAQAADTAVEEEPVAAECYG